MQTFPATVKYSAGPPKDFGDGPKYNIVFEPNDSRVYDRYRVAGGGEKMRVNKPAAKADYLKTLREGDAITVVVAGNTKDGYPWFDLLETNAQGGFAIEDPIVDDLLGPPHAQPRYEGPPPQAPQPQQHAPPAQAAPTGPSDFGVWADREARRLCILYNALEAQMPDVTATVLQPMAVSLYIQYNMDKKR